jgi:hypothetical protein
MLPAYQRADRSRKQCIVVDAAGRDRYKPPRRAIRSAPAEEDDMTTRLAIAAGAWLALTAPVLAEDAPTFPPGSVAEALKARIGKPVTLHLESGTQIGGTVAEVRSQAIVLKGVTGRDFSDALVVLDRIAVVEVRARQR